MDAAFTYLGQGTVASQYSDLGIVNSYGDYQIGLDYSASNFSALDRFGEVLNQVWSSYGRSGGGSLSNLGVLDGYAYTRDAAGNIVSKENVPANALTDAVSASSTITTRSTS